MISWLKFIFILTLCPSIARAENYMLMFGQTNGLDPKVASENKEGITNFRKSLSTNWQSSAYFDDGQVPNSKPGTLKNLNEAFSDLINKSINGDQVLLYVAGAGYEGTTSEVTHSISLGGQKVSLDFLIDLIERLRVKGVKVGFIDSTCFPGASQYINEAIAKRSEEAVKNGRPAIPGACIISLSGVHYFSFASDLIQSRSFMNNFDNVGKGPINLEEHFLSSRNDELNFPHISSLLTPAIDWFDYWQLTTDPQSVWRAERTKSDEPLIKTCPYCYSSDPGKYMKEQFDKLVPLVSTAEALQLAPYRRIVKSKIDEYYSTFIKIENYVEGINHILTNHPEAPPRFGNTPIGDLITEYNSLMLKLDKNRAELLAAYNKFYYVFHVGKENYATGDFIKKRENSYCQEIQLKP
jgi:hypothetical protein